MELFYGIPSDNLIILGEDESNHLIHVKRARSGDEVFVTDGLGHFFETTIQSIEKKQCTLQITSTETKIRQPYSLHIAIAPTKNIDRVEWFLEKATEIGIEEITFLICRHSERREIKTDRLMRVLISSMKQSLKPYLPKLNPITDYKTFIENHNSGTRLIFHMSAGDNNSLNTLYKANDNLLALIGPEGDFHADELELAGKNGFQQASLGSSRLRTETAALSICTIFNFINSR